MSSYSSNRSQVERGDDRDLLLSIRRSRKSLRHQFLARYGEEIERDWRLEGKAYVDPRRGVSYPHNLDDALLFSILCIITYRLYEREPWGLVDGKMIFDFTFPPIEEVVQLLADCQEEVTRSEIVPPSYIMQSLGLYQSLWQTGVI